MDGNQGKVGRAGRALLFAFTGWWMGLGERAGAGGTGILACATGPFRVLNDKIVIRAGQQVRPYGFIPGSVSDAPNSIS